MQLSVCACVIERGSWLAFQVWRVRAGMRAHKYASVFPPLFVSLLCSSVRAATAALQRQKPPLALLSGPRTEHQRETRSPTQVDGHGHGHGDGRGAVQMRGHVLDQSGIRNIDACFKKVEKAFDGNEHVIEAATVGQGYDEQLKEIMDSELLHIVDDFDQKQKSETEYVERLQTAADNFIAAASKLPRAKCIPPCGFQGGDTVYSCITCRYGSCEFPLDCPVKEMQVEENNRTRMQCDVPFELPKNVEVAWRFAEMVETQKWDLFEDVTSGVDVLYSIPSTSLQHRGTYQCEIYSEGHSIVRLYFYLSVTPQLAVGHTELQEIFDLCLLPGGQLLPGTEDHHHSIFHPTLVLLTACFTSVLLMVLLSLGALILSIKEDQISVQANENGE